MPIRLLAVDLDGTLVNSQSEISIANREALRAASERGVEVVIVTGRRFHSARQFVEQLACPVTVISSNGARISNREGEACHRDFLSAAVAREVVRSTPDFRRYAVLIYDFDERGQVTMQEGGSLDGPLGWYRRNSPDALLEVADLEAAIRPDLDPIQVMFGGPPRELEPLESQLAASSSASAVHLTWTRYPARNIALLDVMNRGCSKGRGLRLWAAQRGIEPADVMAIGDNHNDREMLEFAGLPVVMGNAQPGLSRDGWAVTLSNDEDGVAAAVSRFILI